MSLGTAPNWKDHKIEAKKINKIKAMHLNISMYSPCDALLTRPCIRYIFIVMYLCLKYYQTHTHTYPYVKKKNNKILPSTLS